MARPIFKNVGTEPRMYLHKLINYTFPHENLNKLRTPHKSAKSKVKLPRLPPQSTVYYLRLCYLYQKTEFLRTVASWRVYNHRLFNCRINTIIGDIRMQLCWKIDIFEYK